MLDTFTSVCFARWSWSLVGQAFASLGMASWTFIWVWFFSYWAFLALAVHCPSFHEIRRVVTVYCSLLYNDDVHYGGLCVLAASSA